MKLHLPAFLVIAILSAMGAQLLFAAPITDSITSDTTLSSDTPVNIIDGSGIDHKTDTIDPLNIMIDGQANINVSGGNSIIYGIYKFINSSSLTIKGLNDNATLNLDLTPGIEDALGIFSYGNTHLTDIDVKTSVKINDGGNSISNVIGIASWTASITLHKATAISVTGHDIKGRLFGVDVLEKGSVIKFEDDLSITIAGSLKNAFYASELNAAYGGVAELNGRTLISVTENGAGGSGIFLGISSAFDNPIINIKAPIDISVFSATPENVVGMLAQGGAIYSLAQTKILTSPRALAIQASSDGGAGIVHISRHSDIDELTKVEAVPGSITGDISVEDSASRVHVNLTGKLDDGSISFYEGATHNVDGTINLGLHDGAEWRIMDKPDDKGVVISAMTNISLSNRGVIDLVTYSRPGNPDNTFRALSLANTNVHIVDSMTLRLNTDLANGVSDKLIFANEYDASGQIAYLEVMHDPSINQLGDKVTATPGQELEVIQNFNGGTIRAEGNTYAYDSLLQQGVLKVTITPEGKIQELELLASSPPTVDPDPPVSTPVSTASDDVAAMRGMALFTSREMTRHLFDLQALSNSMRKNALWSLVWGGSANAGSIAQVSRGFDQNLYGVQLGSDFILNKGETVVGGFIEHAQADNSYHRGSGKTNGNGFGIYSSWMPGTSYINVAAKIQRMDSDYHSVNLQDLSVSGDYWTWIYTATIEAGHRFSLPYCPLWLEPQAGLTLSHIEGFLYTNSQGTRIHSSGINSALAHAGVGLGWNVANNTSLYIKASILNDMGDNGRILASFSGNSIVVPMYDMTDTWGEFTLGMNTNFSDSLQFFSNATTTTGGDYNLDWTVTVGIRYSF